MYLDYTSGINAYIFFFLKKLFENQAGWKSSRHNQVYRELCLFLNFTVMEEELPWKEHTHSSCPQFFFSHEQRNDSGHLFGMVLLLLFSACSPCAGIAYRIGWGSIVIFQGFLRLDGQFPALPWLCTRKAINSKHIRIVFPPGFYLQYGDLLDSCPFLSLSKFG